MDEGAPDTETGMDADPKPAQVEAGAEMTVVSRAVLLVGCLTSTAAYILTVFLSVCCLLRLHGPRC